MLGKSLLPLEHKCVGETTTSKQADRWIMHIIENTNQAKKLFVTLSKISKNVKSFGNFVTTMFAMPVSASETGNYKFVI